jgi:hypothetical protein
MSQISVEDAGLNPSVWNHHWTFLLVAGGALCETNSRESETYLYFKVFCVFGV